ncbi:MAG TPA: hypothetical protein VG818_06610, partial [Gemmatimonadaceae bacterium]|nr:hypothetical protein [Gemmatimonadaceae bacterium]
FPLWNPYLFGGMPYVAAMHGDIFYPTFLLRMVMRTDLAMTWGFAIHLFLAGIFTYGFLRAWGFGFYASLFGGVAYMLSGQIASLASPGHDGKLFVSALFPLALWMLIAGMRLGRRWAWGVLALAVGLAVLSPHPQLLQYMLLGAGAFALFLAFTDHEGRGALERRVAFSRLGLALGSVVIGALIGAIQILPLREYTPWSPRAGGHTYEQATQFSMPIEEFFNTYLPQFTGMLRHYWGRNGIHFHSEYLGVVVLIMLGAAIGATPRKGFRRFWAWTLLVAALWALGEHTPFYQLVYAVVPGTKFFRAPSTIFFICSFAASVLATVGFERAMARRVSARYAIGWLVGAGVVALLASGGMLTNLAQTIAASFAGTARYELVADNNGLLILGAWRSFLAAGITCALLIAWWRQQVSLRTFAIAIVAVTAVDLWSIARDYWMFSPPATTLYASDPAIDYIKAQPQPGRVLTLPLSEDGLASRDPFFMGDGMMVQRVRELGNYHGNELGHYQQLGNYDGQQYNNFINPAFWRLENMQYLYTNVDDTTATKVFAQAGLKDFAFRKLVGPVRNAAGSMVYLLAPPVTNPYAWVTAAYVTGNDRQSLPTVLDPGYDPRLVAIFDTTSHLESAKLAQLPPAPTVKASVAKYEPGHMVVDLDAPAPAGAALVLSENFYPGWRATADGKPVTVNRADYTLLGVALPAGARHLEFTFDDAAYDTGKKLTLAALLLVVLAIAGGVASERMRRG